MSQWHSLSLQESSSPLMEQLADFHDHSMVVVILVVTFVGVGLFSLLSNLCVNRFLLESQGVEIVWTVIPALILVSIALPSLRLLYLLDEVQEPSVTLKVVGHQWYWSYEYSDFKEVEFDSYMVPTSELSKSGLRGLEVDTRAVIPYHSQIRFLVTAADVIHSWALPSAGVKVDAIPGRLNQVSFMSVKSGVFFGQCSEICGANHSFMPVALESVSSETFVAWVTRAS